MTSQQGIKEKAKQNSDFIEHYNTCTINLTLKLFEKQFGKIIEIYQDVITAILN